MTIPMTIKPPEIQTLFQQLNDIPVSTSESTMIYGDKSGKSWLLGTLGDRNLWICLDPNGYETIRSRSFIDKVGRVNPTIVEIYENYDSFGMPNSSTAYDKVYEVLEYAFKNLLPTFDHVCIDSLTSYRKAAMFKALDVNSITRKSRTKVEIMDKLNAVLPALQDYGTEIALVQQFIDLCLANCRRFNKHLWITAHERHMFTKSPEGKEEYRGIRPALTGRALPNEITSMFSNVFYTKQYGKGIYRIHTEGDGEFVANTRHGGVWGSPIPDPTIKRHEVLFKNGPNLSIMLDELKRDAAINPPTGV